MILMDAEQAEDFFGTGPIPETVTVRPRAEIDAYIASLIA